jgi:VWFA-related protein
MTVGRRRSSGGRSPRAVLAAALVAVGGAAALVAQRGAQQPVFRTTLEIVQIDVIVRDADGNPMHGLSADDFVILDRGKPQDVATFKEIQRDTEPPAPRFPPSLRLDVATNATARSERLVVMVLDDLHGYRGRDETVQTVARRIVEDLGPRSTMALVTTSGDQRVEPTEDRSRLLEAIGRYKGARAQRRPIPAMDSRRGDASLQDFDANMRLYSALEGAAKVLGANDGRRKAFVLISENVAKDLSGLFSSGVPPGQGPPDVSAYFRTGDPEALIQVPQWQHHDYSILEMLEAMRRGNVATYAIDPRGHVPPEKLLQECFPMPAIFDARHDPCSGGESLPDWNSWIRQAQHGLEIMAEASGGFAVVNTNDFAGGIDRILTDLDNYYLLGFAPPDTTTKGYRRLEVRLRNHPEATLRYRRGYDLGDRDETKKATDPLFALSSGALPSTDLPLRMHAAVLPGSGRDARVTVALEATVPRVTMQTSDASVQDEIRYAILAVDTKGAKVKEAVGRGARMVLRPRDPSRPAPEHVVYQVGETMSLPPGQYQLRASAASVKLGSGGSVYLAIDVPDFREPRLAVSGVVVGYAGGPRVPSFAPPPLGARGSGAGRRAGGGLGRGRGPGTQAAPAGRGSGIPEGLPFAPTVDREFTTADDLALYFEILRRDRAREVAIAVMVVDAQDRVVRRYSQMLPKDHAGKVTFGLPLSQVGPGLFRLRVAVTDGTNDATSEVGVAIVSAEKRI